MKLIIVESPTKARTLSRFLGPDYTIEATMGHLRDLPEKTLGVEIKGENFSPQYEIVDKKKETIKKLQTLAKKAEVVILATDPDREGEAIAWHVGEILRETKESKESKETTRIVFHEITETAIKEALAHPGQIEMNLVDAQQARRILDRLVGYKLSPVLWRKIRRGLSAGRVQSVSVRLIVEREREIKAFKTEEYWEIVVRLKKDSPFQGESLTKSLPMEFEANLVKVEIKTKDEAEKIVAELQKTQYSVKSLEISDLRKFPYPPFTTSTLQQAASNLFGWSAKHTMQVAQRLYEKGLITYHRTDSLNLASQAVSMVRDFIKKEYGQAYLPVSAKFYKTKSKVAQEAHEAIRPTDVKSEIRNPKSETLERDEERLYDLIWKRFVACQMNEAVYEQTKVEIQTMNSPQPPDGHREGSDSPSPERRGQGEVNENSFLFRAVGSLLKFDGWKKLYGEGTRETEETEGTNVLPFLVAGEILNLLQLFPSQHFTQPPARFTEASLIKALEEKGIGRPSTYAPIISTIQERQYVEKVEKKFSPTALGETVNDFLITNFPQELDYDFTAKMEDDLDEIATGEKKWQPVLSEFYGPFLKKVEEVSKDAPRAQVPVEETEEICEKCGGKMVIRLGRFGKFLACSNFPKCKNTKPLVVKTDLKCPKCQGEIVLRKTKRGRHFYGCNNYPKCDFAAWKKEEILKSVSPASKGNALQN